MKSTEIETTQQAEVAFISPSALFEHWQGHRRLTRRMIQAFPEDKLFTHSIGGMRPFSELIMEMVAMASPGIHGVKTGKWPTYKTDNAPKTKEGLLKLWDSVTEELNTVWPQIDPQRFAQVESAFGMYEGPNYQSILYFIDNEIHHRGQGYVYLRSLGIEPPPFWERA